MNLKSLLIVPAALVLFAPKPAQAYVGFRIGVGVPLFFPWYGYYSPAPVEYTHTVVYAAPPRAVGEQISPPPGPGFVWIAAHWSNVGQRWVWVGGRWEMPPSSSALWAPGHWVQGNAGWVWFDGAWTVGNSAGVAAGQPPGPPPTPPGSPAAASGPGPAAPEAVAVPSSPAPEVPLMADGMVVADQPPAPISEFIPASPYPDYVWVGGYWGWNNGWYWTSGRYAHRPFRGAAWVSGGWSRGPRGWGWHGGRWH